MSGKHFLNGLGEYRSEGFGKVIVNPCFLESDEHGRVSLDLASARVETIDSDGVSEVSSSGKVFSKWFEARRNEHNREQAILSEVNSFIRGTGKYFIGITSSQWGQIRSRASEVEKYEDLVRMLFQKPERTSYSSTRSGERHTHGLLVHGKTAQAWNRSKGGKTLYQILAEELKRNREFGPIYAVRLAAAMQGVSKRSGSEREGRGR